MDIQRLYKLFLESSGVTTDSRKIQKNQLFFALKGELFDGNQYAAAAIQSGAKAAIIDDEKYQISEQTILVEDVLKSLQSLAHYHRKQFQIPIIGITGSNGKTTTKELVTKVLKEKYNVLATIGNLNNHIGVPLTLLNLNAQHEIAIVEMGANHIHEIAQLSAISEPNYGVITSIGKAHIGEFGSFEAIKNTKAELYEWLVSHDGVVFLNQDVEELVEMAEKTHVEKMVTYGSHTQNQFSFQYLESNPNVKFSCEHTIIQTQLPGRYNFNNFMTAAAIGRYFDVPLSNIQTALERYRSDNNRSQIVVKGANTFILDAYNANPSSMEAALENLKNMETDKKGAIIGHMLELGKYSHEEHQKIVRIAEKLPLDFLVFIGEEFSDTLKSPSSLYFPNTSEAITWWNAQKLENSLVLIKGSRKLQLEKILQ